ncbi:MAG: penicillin-binding transpeptidase domain-containing protein [Bryobacteraceae bacterium]
MITRRHIFAAFAARSSAGAAVVLRIEDGVPLRVENETFAARPAGAPGSALKPWLLEALRPWKSRVCTGTLRIGSHRLDCIHAPAGALDAEGALAASCNQWFAAAALAAGPHRILERLQQGGAEARLARTPEELQLQALGLEGVSVSVFAMARIFRNLALHGAPEIAAGLCRAVREGTAQAAQVDGIDVAGKTGTSRDGAWFGGFAPAGKPAVAVAVFRPGGRGPSEAAPAAAELFQWARRSGWL